MQKGLMAGLSGAVLALILLAGCGDGAWNNPWPAREAEANVLYSSFEERPKHLDPARSYSSNEYAFLAQIYEPPLQYHFLLRPYRLIPLTAESLPEPAYFDAAGQALPQNAPAEAIAWSEYRISIRPGSHYQPHPAFAKDAAGDYRYHHLTLGDLEGVNRLADFPETGTRELTAADYVYQIKRLAHPKLHSPIYGLMADYIAGLREYAEVLKRVAKSTRGRNVSGSARLSVGRSEGG